ncbi:MAG TPA: ABC transporter substrate-binding protein, partial [Treponemataceae bacterium]|nr:ABC transporter substrate-binding protein [Treponemataceae bacterium]
MKVRNVIFVALALSIVMVASGCTKSGSETIKIGVAGAHSGDLASYGLPTVNAAKLVAEEYNAKGGIRGKKIELIIV